MKYILVSLVLLPSFCSDRVITITNPQVFEYELDCQARSERYKRHPEIKVIVDCQSVKEE